MDASVKLRHGNLFDGPTDLIVLPCSTSGTITGFVARALASYSIPHPRESMKLGEVEIMPFKGGEHLAQYVAFAASVRRNSSSDTAIEEIGRALGEFTAKKASVRNVAVPLLGAGAGGLKAEAVVTALRAGFIATAAPDATLVIHVLEQELFSRLKSNRAAIKGSGRKEVVRVFISHTA